MGQRDVSGGDSVHCVLCVDLGLSPQVGASVPFGSIG